MFFFNLFCFIHELWSAPNIYEDCIWLVHAMNMLGLPYQNPIKYIKVCDFYVTQWEKYSRGMNTFFESK